MEDKCCNDDVFVDNEIYNFIIEGGRGSSDTDDSDCYDTDDSNISVWGL